MAGAFSLSFRFGRSFDLVLTAAAVPVPLLAPCISGSAAPPRNGPARRGHS